MGLYEEFSINLDNEDKQKCVDMILAQIDKGVGIEEIYSTILAPSLNEMECRLEDAEICVWKEHVKTSIVRTIIECCYPYVEKEREKNGTPKRGESVAVLCPPEELHEIGARMVADFFTLCGFDVTFVGANTPVDDFVEAIVHIKPRYVAISVTNPYNLMAVRKIIARIREKHPGTTELIVGGRAFAKNPGMYKEIGADHLLNSYAEIYGLVGTNATKDERGL